MSRMIDYVNPELLPKDEKLLPTESQEQRKLFGWAERMSYFHPELKMMFHVPNGGGRSKAEAGRFKAEGVKAGVPDIFLPVPSHGMHGLFIELKKIKGGRVSPEQKQWIEDLTMQGYAAIVCHGAAEAEEMICDYLGIAKDRAC